jgi:hypothetical protein
MNTYRFEIEGIFESRLTFEELDRRRLVIVSDAGDDLTDTLEKIATDSIEFEKVNLVQICPHDGSELKYRMFDIDGTNLEEHAVCLECRYGAPPLR